jgi:hypothetical protein
LFLSGPPLHYLPGIPSGKLLKNLSAPVEGADGDAHSRSDTPSFQGGSPRYPGTGLSGNWAGDRLPKRPAVLPGKRIRPCRGTPNAAVLSCVSAGGNSICAGKRELGRRMILSLRNPWTFWKGGQIYPYERFFLKPVSLACGPLGFETDSNKFGGN